MSIVHAFTVPRKINRMRADKFLKLYNIPFDSRNKIAARNCICHSVVDIELIKLYIIIYRKEIIVIKKHDHSYEVQFLFLHSS